MSHGQKIYQNGVLHILVPYHCMSLNLSTVKLWRATDMIREMNQYLRIYQSNDVRQNQALGDHCDEMDFCLFFEDIVLHEIENRIDG